MPNIELGAVLPHDALPESDNDSDFVIYYFMRSTSCAICRGHVLLLAKRYPKLRTAGASVVILAPEGGEAVKAVETELKLPFPMRSSSTAYSAMQLARVLFGTWQQSGTLVVNRQRRVVLVRRAVNPFNALNERELFDAISPQTVASVPAL